jgi:hypothetical protein
MNPILDDHIPSKNHIEALGISDDTVNDGRRIDAKLEIELVETRSVQSLRTG